MSSPVDQLVEMGFPPNRAEKALVKTNHKGVQQAMDWLLEHSEDPDIDTPISQGHVLSDGPGEGGEGSGEGGGSASKDLEALSIKCDQCGKLLKSEAQAQSHATRTGHTQFSESTEEVKPLTEEEKKEQQEKLQKLIKEKRQARLEKEKKEALEKEKSRRKGGREMVEAKQRMEMREAKKIADLKRREKEEERIAKQKVKEQIARDRLERQNKFAKSAASSAAAPAPTSLAKPNPSQVQKLKEYRECRLQIRLPDGSTLRNNFAATDTLRAVLTYVESEKGLENHSLATAFPSKLFTESDMDLSLKEAGLLPSAVLIVKKKLLPG
ncbi:UBX domain-containing protein 1-B-like isoform X2 [Oscarella lobularis]|uniref:UBX domain-containing protein 1-B-like isoform X2 n=1 Tax=Oscarella lobularis TaxID=121494 RepID=UPI0033139620